MAGGWFTKQGDFLTAAYLNDVNDVTVGGQIQYVPTNVTASQGIQTQPGDRIILDDATASALSDTTIGTLYGGMYMYVQSTYTTQIPVLGAAAFYKAADVGNLAPTSPNTTSYVAYSDAQPTTAIPSYFLGVYINVITKNNYGWIQIGGMATCLFDSALTATAAGNWVSVKVSSSVASCFDCGAVVGVVTLSALVGTAVGLPATSTASKVSIWRGFGRL
jgi:hypothetical protein